MSYRARYIVGQYTTEAVPGGNDLVVCNPPYIPVPDDSSILRSLDPHVRATIGTDLLENVVRDANYLLAQGGLLVLVASEMAEGAIASSVPEGFEMRRLHSQRVVFDIGSVRGDRAFLRSLRNHGFIEGRGGRSPAYSHRIGVYVLGRV